MSDRCRMFDLIEKAPAACFLTLINNRDPGKVLGKLDIKTNFDERNSKSFVTLKLFCESYEDLVMHFFIICILPPKKKSMQNLCPIRSLDDVSIWLQKEVDIPMSDYAIYIYI